MITRRTSFSVIGAAIAAVWSQRPANAQFTEQQVRNSSQVVSTGDVNVSQEAAGSQEVVAVNGVPISGDGVYRSNNEQFIVNDNQVVSTGSVNVEQRASGSQTVYTETLYSGMPAGQCNPGAVLANPDTGQLFFQGRDCCWWPACSDQCKSCKRC